jgi:hypothetical protein
MDEFALLLQRNPSVARESHQHALMAQILASGLHCQDRQLSLIGNLDEHVPESVG